MQAVAHLIEQLTPEQHASRQGLHTPVITPSTPSTQRWSESPICASGDDVDEDEAYFLDEDDEDDDDEDDEYDDDDDDDLDDDNDEIEPEKDQDEDDF